MTLDVIRRSQPGKVIAIPLGKRSRDIPDTLHGIPVIGANQHVRYLGVQVGTDEHVQANWDACQASLMTRLALARAKTHTVTQRAEIARAIIVPKVMFCARYAWPTVEHVKKIQDLVKRFVWGATGEWKARAWMSEEQAELPVKQGGIGYPNLTTELLTLSAATVARWASDSSQDERILGDLLSEYSSTGSNYITPVPASTDKVWSTEGLWATGRNVLTTLPEMYTHIANPTEISSIARLIAPATRRGVWKEGEYEIEVEDATLQAVLIRTKKQKEDQGQFCHEWLPFCNINTKQWLLSANGQPYDISKSRLATQAREIRDIVGWRWIKLGCVRFHISRDQDSISAPTLRAFEHLCGTILANFPELLLRPRTEQALRPLNPDLERDHDWYLDGTTKVRHQDTAITICEYRIQRPSDADAQATMDLREPPVAFHPHPRLSRIVALR